MFKTLLDKDKRENIKEHVEVVFAVFTIASFVMKKVQDHKKTNAEIEGDTEQTCS